MHARTPEQARAEKAALEAARQEALARVEALLTIPGLSAGVQRELEDCKQDIRGASSLAHLGHILKQVEFVAARAGIDSATLINLTREQRIESLWKNISQLSEQIGDALEELGMTDEQKAERRRLQKDLDDAKTAEERKAALAALKQWEKEFLEGKQREIDAMPAGEAKDEAQHNFNTTKTTVVDSATQKRDELEAQGTALARKHGANSDKGQASEDVSLPPLPGFDQPKGRSK